MYPNKLTTSLMSSYNFSILTFFHEISCTTCHKFVFSQQNCRIDQCKNKNNPKCKYLEMYKIPNKYSNPNSNFELVQ